MANSQLFPLISADAETESLFRSILCAEFKAYTVLAVAHRLETIVDFDLVVVMEAGRIVECGPPAALLEAPAGGFREMWERRG